MTELPPPQNRPIPRTRSRLRRAAGLLIAAVVTAAAAVAAVSPASAVNVSIIANYNSAAGGLDHSKLLNANEGGYLTHKALNWLPESYPQFKQAGLRMVAITHLLNENFYNVVSGTAPNFEYDFDKLDRVVLPLVKEGMTPLMGVAFTPQVLGGADKATGYSNAIPNNNEHWKSIVYALVKHYKDLGHTGWYWELWNEPDLGGFWAGTQAQYNALYAATVEGIKDADDTAQVGGPTTTQGGWTFFDGFTSYLQANPSVPLDFASFHTYGPDPTFGLVDRAKSSLDAAGRTGVPIFITEWNITPVMTSGSGAPSDTNAGAAYAARRLADALRRPALTKVFWFSPKEGLQPTTLFNGDLGILTVDGHKKATYNTHALIDKLQSTMLSTTVTGPGTGNQAVGAVATKDPATGKAAVLVWNDQPSGTDFTVELNNLPYVAQQRNVKVTRYLVDATHGNYHKDYAAGLRGWAVGPTENADPVDSRIIASTANFSHTLAVGPHSVVAYVLEPTTAAPSNDQQLGPAPIPVGTRNLAHGQPVSSSSTVPPNWGWSAGALTDGLTHTFTKVDSGPASNGWSSAAHTTANAIEWAYVDLGYSAQLNRVKLFPRDDMACEGYGFPLDFEIQGSNDAVNWAPMRTLTNYNGGSPIAAPVKAQTFDVAGNFRYVRVYATRLQVACAGAAERHLQLAELQVESEENVATGSTVSASPSIQDWGWSTAYVNDGIESSAGAAHGWSSVGQTTNHTAQVTLQRAAATGVSRIDLFPRDDPGSEGRGFPRDFTIQVATNDACTTWSTVASYTDLDNPGKFRRTFGIPTRVTRCVRIEATDLYQFPDGIYMFQLAELKLHH